MSRGKGTVSDSSSSNGFSWYRLTISRFQLNVIDCNRFLNHCFVVEEKEKLKRKKMNGDNELFCIVC